MPLRLARRAREIVMNKPQTTTAVSNAEAKPVRGLFIDGKEQPAGSRETFPIISPGTGEVIAHSINANEADVDATIASARRAFEDPSWKKMSERTRAKFVYKLGDALEKHLDELYELETLNNGRPTRETRAAWKSGGSISLQRRPCAGETRRGDSRRWQLPRLHVAPAGRRRRQYNALQS